MPRGPRIAAKAARGDLSPEQFLALVIGPNPAAPAFAGDAEMREAWEWSRDDIMSRMIAGARPWAWWRHESTDGVDRTYGDGLKYLTEHGELSDAEVRQLAAWKRNSKGEEMDVLGVADELTQGELRECADGLSAMARRWRQEHGSEGIGVYLDQWSERFAAFAAARDGGPYPVEVAFDTLRTESVAELAELHRYLREVSDDSCNDRVVMAGMSMVAAPLEIALIGRDAIEPEPVSGPPVDGIQ